MSSSLLDERESPRIDIGYREFHARLAIQSAGRIATNSRDRATPIGQVAKDAFTHAERSDVL